MTGFGRGVADAAGARATVELRSVNHRHLDLKMRAQLAPALEDQITAKLRAAIDRGSISVAISIEAENDSRIDEAAALAAHRSLSQLAQRLGVEGPSLAMVLAQPGVVAGTPKVDDALILAALDTAIAELQTMRAAEGKTLAVDLLARLGDLASERAAIAELAKTVNETLRGKLVDRLTKLAADVAIEPARIAQEAALAADRADITEELVRLASHLEQARTLIYGKAPAGRKLDFLVQEIGRELNTIGSKSALVDVTNHVVESKAMLEKIREQVQNVE